MTSNKVFISTFSNYIDEYESSMRRISEWKPNLDYTTFGVIIEYSNIEESIKQIFQKLMNPNRIKDSITKEELDELKLLKSLIIPKNSQNVKLKNSLLRIQEIKNLSKYIPDVELYY